MPEEKKWSEAMFNKKETGIDPQHNEKIISRRFGEGIPFYHPKVKIYPIFSEGREKHDIYEKKSGGDNLHLELEGTPKEREQMLGGITKRFGATSAVQTLWDGAGLRSCYNIWDENNGMLSSVQSNEITIVFTFKAASNVLGEYVGYAGWDKKEVSLSEELAKKYGASSIHKFIAKGSMFKAIEKTLREGVEVAKTIGADVIRIWNMKIGMKSTTLEIKFYRKEET